ncbi:signal peptidase I [Nocardioides sp. W3-2-3]|uniref:signal peptidase I n=1 Tax=Nocardioides convexus TaxID=2712224 RepID=UPI002418775E|nr:signal peptidase I [Nocardioides convexus]NHA01496.1 signal peptidase I [Nocardioides convexus]
MRALWGIVAVLLVPALTGCGGGEEGPADGRKVTFRGSVTAGSMEPGLRPGDRLVATEVGAGGPRTGDVVVYRDPGGWLGLDSEDGTLVHRVIGTPGDTIVCCDAQGRIAVDGEALDEPYLAPEPGACDAPLIALWAGPARDGHRRRVPVDGRPGAGGPALRAGRQPRPRGRLARAPVPGDRAVPRWSLGARRPGPRHRRAAAHCYADRRARSLIAVITAVLASA